MATNKKYIRHKKYTCDKCIYGMHCSDNWWANHYICGYLLITGHIRDCKAENCEKFVQITKKQRRRKANDEA